MAAHQAKVASPAMPDVARLASMNRPVRVRISSVTVSTRARLLAATKRNPNCLISGRATIR